jgi:hypothetical protein
MVQCAALLFLLFCSLLGTTQPLRFRCVDSQSGEPLSNAAVCYLQQRSICAIADSQGVVVIPFLAGDTLFFSRVGYAQKFIPGQQIKQGAVVSLQRNVIELPLLELSSAEFITVNELGSPSKIANGKIMMFPQLELGRLFTVKDSLFTLGAFTLHFAPLLQTTQLLSFAVYSLDPVDKLPSEKLYEQFFRIQAADIPITQARIRLPSPIKLPTSFVLAVRFLGVEQGEARQVELLYSSRKAGIECFERYFSEKWKAAPHLFFLTTSSRKNRVENASILLQVEVRRIVN